MTIKSRLVIAAAAAFITLLGPAAIANAVVPEYTCNPTPGTPTSCVTGDTTNGGGHGDSSYSDGTPGSVAGVTNSTGSFGGSANAPNAMN